MLQRDALASVSFCYNHCYHKHLWRSRPIEYCISEIKYLIDNYKIDGVCFVDDLFGPNAKYTRDVCEKLIQSKFDIVWGCNMQANTMTKDELLLMHKAGCRWILVGIESGSNERQKLIGKNLNLEKTKEVLKYCSEIGIFVTVSCIIGFPDETQEELKQTIKYMQELSANAKFANFVGFLPNQCCVKK
jgi:anaerobic magnesium-protoporphyrin IX monomethyl ester cyclase